MLEVLGEALGLKTHEIEGPSKRVTVFKICIARAMGLSREHINPIARGAVFHDVGKMAIPDRILRKPPDAGRNRYHAPALHSPL